MAEHNPNRKSERNFNLGKGGQHSFDLEKKATRKFELEKEDEPVIAPKPDENPSGNNGKKKTIWAVVVALIVAALIAFFCIRGCDSSTVDEAQPKVEDTEQSNDNALTDNEDAANLGNGTEMSSEENEQADNATVEGTNGGTSSNQTGVEQSQESNKPSEPATTNPVQTTAPNAPDTPVATTGDVETEAMNVIRGVYGNAPVRYDLMKQKGLDPVAIQRRVNELKRQGVF